MSDKNSPSQHPWLFFVPMGMGIAVGSGVRRQPGWDSRILQILAAAGLAAVVGLVVFLVIQAITRWRSGSPRR